MKPGEDMGFMEDTGNHDAWTEGMSYGMMVCVQLDKKEEFDRLWKWTRTYMYMDGRGIGKELFCIPCALDGTRNADDRHRTGKSILLWHCSLHQEDGGDGEGIFNYSREAKAILHECVHKGEPGHPGDPMWEPSNKLIKFVPGLDFSDPSYHLPHFYELLRNMPMRRIVSSGKALPKQAGPTCIKPVIRIPDCRQSMRIMTEPRTARIRRSSAATTGITVMPIARSQISRCTICGLTGPVAGADCREIPEILLRGSEGSLGRCLFDRRNQTGGESTASGSHHCGQCRKCTGCGRNLCETMC